MSAIEYLGVTINWLGSGVEGRGHLPDRRCIVEVDRGYFRPTEVDTLLGDASKAREKIGWRPRHALQILVDEMVDSDLAEADAALRAATSTRRSLY